METTPQQTGSPEWDGKLFRDLAYIKNKLRYPAGRKVFLPAISGVGMLVLLAFLTYNSFVKNASAHPSATPVFIVAMVCIITLLVANKFFGELKFIVVDTPYDTGRNQKIIEAFLTAQHMIVFRHPEAATVFRIVSKNINPLKEQREVLVFIADERRILINSHFTNAGFSLIPGARHHRQMAGSLHEFIATQSQQA